MADTSAYALPDVRRQMQAWFGGSLSSFVMSGGLPTVPGSSLTLAAFATTAHVRDTAELYYVFQESAAVGPLNTGNGTYWLALHRDTSTDVSGWTRQAGTHYLWQLNASQPAAPAAGTILSRVTVAGGVITAVADYRTPASYARAGVHDVTDPLYGGSLAAAVASAGREIILPRGTFELGATLTLAQGQRLRGAGGQRETTIRKMFNGVMIEAGSLSEISDLNLDGNGASFTGAGINIAASKFSVKLHRLRIFATTAPCIQFANSAGGGTIVSECEGETTSSLTVPFLDVGVDSGATPRFISNCWISGGYIDISSANDTFIKNCYLHHVLTDAATANFYIANTRFALSGATLTIFGAGGMFANCSFAGPVILQNSSGLRFSNSCEFGFGCTEGGGALFNAFTDQATAYTPTWTQASGTQPALGNGTIVGRYYRHGSSCNVQIKLTMGTTTTYGNSATAYLFSLPFFTHNSTSFLQSYPGCAEIFDASTPSSLMCLVSMGFNENVCSVSWGGAGARLDSPQVWAATDYILLNFTYLTR